LPAGLKNIYGKLLFIPTPSSGDQIIKAKTTNV